MEHVFVYPKTNKESEVMYMMKEHQGKSRVPPIESIGTVATILRILSRTFRTALMIENTVK